MYNCNSTVHSSLQLWQKYRDDLASKHVNVTLLTTDLYGPALSYYYI